MENTERITSTDDMGLSFDSSDMLQQILSNHGLIVVSTEKLLDTQPMSLVLASRLSTGQTFGDYALPTSNGILYVEGKLFKEEVQAIIDKSSLDHAPNKIHYFSFSSLNHHAEAPDEKGVYLGNSKNGLIATVQDKKCDTIIINNLATTSNYFLDGSEKDSLKAIRKLQAKKTAVIVFVEKSTKGSGLLHSMADVVFEVTQADNHFDAPINVACIKYPSFEIDPPSPFCLSLSTNEGKWTVTEEIDPDETLDLIISLACRRKTQVEIGAILGLQQYQVSRLLKKADNLGIITRNGRSVRRVK